MRVSVLINSIVIDKKVKEFKARNVFFDQQHGISLSREPSIGYGRSLCEMYRSTDSLMSARYVIILFFSNAMVSEFPNCSFNLSANFKLNLTIYFSSNVRWIPCACFVSICICNPVIMSDTVIIVFVRLRH